MSDEEWFRNLVKTNAQKRSEIAEAHKRSGLESAKEVFVLEKFEALWPSNPIARVLTEAKLSEREERHKIWEDLYYGQFSKLDSIEDFVSELQRLMLHGFFE